VLELRIARLQRLLMVGSGGLAAVELALHPNWPPSPIIPTTPLPSTSKVPSGLKLPADLGPTSGNFAVYLAVVGLRHVFLPASYSCLLCCDVRVFASRAFTVREYACLYCLSIHDPFTGLQ